MVNYEESKIYRITSPKTKEFYIGSTYRELYERLGNHRRDYKSWQEYKFPYVSSFEIVKHKDAVIELLEDFPCATKSELLKREGEWIAANKDHGCINRCQAGRTRKEYQQTDKYKSQKKRTSKLYRQTHQYKEYQKLYNRRKYQQSTEFREKVKKNMRIYYDLQKKGKL